ncbi:MAG: tRNA (adenosine(37)-N6)-threonylcarbamoyltransferase complex ATPase subunit type 1 TsaE [Armatimonadetes bacterium 13_1_40CM_64_14]|nr:MAG: tRNA (adenosine(37)-N6)-threonylcarbamoyltransferase complex ATPase subunit type 1 TsaE [Armatimonadetes bacterium 13_1_40CM_64_14]
MPATRRRVRFETASPTQTEALGARLGRLLQAGDVVALSGDLGAGKTVFARGIARGAGATGYVASPTFTLIREYHGTPPVYHVDLYRLDRPEQLDDLGLDMVFDGSGIVVIEWAEHAFSWLPDDYLWITIRFGAGAEHRVLELEPHGARFEALLAQLGGRTP